jgi:hypothetical protein
MASSSVSRQYGNPRPPEGALGGRKGPRAKALVIDDLQRFRQLTDRGIAPKPISPDVRLAFPNASGQELAAWERRLRHHAAACGCEAAAFALAVVGIGALMCRSAFDIRLAAGSLADAVLWMALAVGVCVVAKLAAVYGSRRALARLFREVEARVQGTG